ncbi:hypothetical protein ZWY2020_058092 [Hordeum vulgare]|nr:hypothetical protein ZWY2020_058092 [Hordeum vulgare]
MPRATTPAPCPLLPRFHRYLHDEPPPQAPLATDRPPEPPHRAAASSAFGRLPRSTQAFAERAHSTRQLAAAELLPAVMPITNEPGIAAAGSRCSRRWCTEKKARVRHHVQPVSTIMVSIRHFIFGEPIRRSIIGGVVVILGLYMLLWGKDKDQEYKAGAASGEKQAGLPDLDREAEAAGGEDGRRLLGAGWLGTGDQTT